ncbi:LOW QUALITY PROTEIN: homeobox-leucine zipper protein HDG7-like [Hibiscus syriacus]|uniref:LOW QUALITY PROTEIN: homeobox-leucine zipper protein HDG7-like n=1 Tax=Hibiscus syriacus TaxID=106335 RepID=UPI001920AD93|nr:LOW QUALITY PROTEIN: homeobox-leucine zipper protein HDG7-like [Hibiscus syriacus]
MDSHSWIDLIGFEENFDLGLDLLGIMNEDEFESSASFEGAPADNGEPPKKKKNKRHTPYQIHELESFFKDFPHPNAKQTRELSLRLGLEKQQIKFWFQNRRNQLKTQFGRHENAILKQENERLRVENGFLKQEITRRMCNNCGGNNGGSTLPMGFKLEDWVSMPLIEPSGTYGSPYDRSALVNVAVAAMDELIKMAEMHNPPVEATRETGLVPLRSSALVEMLMDANCWAEMFPCLVARATTVDVLSSGTGGTRDNALQVMDAEFQVLSPLVPIQRVQFLRFCKRHSDGVWAVVDVSIDSCNAANPHMFANSRKLPSGCIIQDMDNKHTKVTWVEHSENDESTIHHLSCPLLSSGFSFGAPRWIDTLRRHCHRFAQLMSPAIHGITAAGTKSMLNLARRMTYNFAAGICSSSARKWYELNVGNVGEDVRVMVRKNENLPGEPCGVVLSASTSVWMPITQQRLFDFLRDARMRCQWDILSKGISMKSTIDVAKGPGQGDCVTLFSSGLTESATLVLQETWSDASCALIVYAPVDVPSISAVMKGGDSSQVVMLPSGFAILPSSHGAERQSNCDRPWTELEMDRSTSSGCILTVGFHVLVKGPGGKLTMESVESVSKLLSGQVEKIKAALSVT